MHHSYWAQTLEPMLHSNTKRWLYTWTSPNGDEIKLPTFTGLQRKQRNFRKTSLSDSSTIWKPLTMWIMTNCGNLLERWEYQTIIAVYWETCMQAKKQQLEPCMEQLIGSRLRKEYNMAVCCHPVSVTYMLGTSLEMSGWVSYNLEHSIIYT